MLMAAGLPLPGQVFAHGWLLVGGEKMSKSKLTGIAPSQIIDHFGVGRVPLLLPARDPVRPGRLVLLGGHEPPATPPSWPTAWATSASRATAMVGKYFDGVLPAPGAFANADLALADALLADGAGRRRARTRKLDFTGGIGAVKALRRRGQPLRHRAGAVGAGQASRRPGRPRAAGHGALHDLRGAARDRRAAQRRDAAGHGRAVGVDRRGRGPGRDRRPARSRTSAAGASCPPACGSPRAPRCSRACPRRPPAGA